MDETGPDIQALDLPNLKEICILCLLPSTKRFAVSSLVNINRTAIKDALCKHFWFTEQLCKKRYICDTCWEMTAKFHRFYIQIEHLHSMRSATTVKEECDYSDGDNKSPISESVVTSTENDLIALNEVYIEENHPEPGETPADTDGIAISEISEDESGTESSYPLSTRMKKRTRNGKVKTLRPDAFANSTHKPTWGLSLCRINGKMLEVSCHECYAKHGGQAKAEYLPFAALMKHYRNEHNSVGYAVCCNRKYLRKRSLKIHILSHGRNVIYRCHLCAIKFRKQESLDEHNMLIHTSDAEKQFKCEKCQKAFATEHLLNSHSNWHENVEQKNICCDPCNIFFSSVPALEKHRSLHHPSPDGAKATVPADVMKDVKMPEEKLEHLQYRIRLSEAKLSEQDELINRYCLALCHVCDFQATNFTTLKEHVNQEHNVRSVHMVCCERTYNKRQTLYDHCLLHENPDCFQCTVCSKRYANSRSLQDHKWRIHTPVAERPFACDVCGVTFVKDYLLKQHLAHHLRKEKKLNYCDMCDKSFTTGTALKSHRQTFHGALFNLICDICARGFNSRSVLETHRMTHSVEGKSQLKHQCEQCQKWLGNKRSYHQHRLRCHANNGPVSCKFCGKESANSSALKSHVHLHHATRPEYACTFCEKNFKTPLRLREHEATHTGSILYRCPWCPRTFACGSNMYKHRKASHPQEWAAFVQKRFGER